MKPADFKAPKEYLERKSVIADRICHVRKEDSSFLFPLTWECHTLFGNPNPVKVEFCSGNGLWISEKAVAEPETNWVAVEIKLGRTKKIWSKIKNLQLTNLLVVNGEGDFVTQNHFPKESVESVFINFPDPWPKRHHAKFRLVCPPFVEALANLLKANGSVTIVTDDPGHSDWILKSFKACQKFECPLPSPYYSVGDSNYGHSYFESLWRSQGRLIRHHYFVKK